MKSKKVVLSALFVMICSVAYSQLHPERKFIRSGNRDFEKGAYDDSEVDYLRAREMNPASYEATFNLADAHYKQERYQEAQAAFEVLASLENNDPLRRADAYYNLGNSYFQQEKYKEALEAFKNAMRLNPADTDAKFNYAYTKKKLEQDQNQDNDQNQNDNQNDQDQNNDQNQDNQDQNDDKNDPQQDKGDGQQPQPEGAISRDEAEKMLDAIQNSEDNTREKMDAEKAPVGVVGGKNW